MTLQSTSGGFRLSAPIYFTGIALVTALGIGLAIHWRPALKYSIRSALGLEKPARAAADSFYSVRVAPLLEEHCTGCHGANRQKADLRLDGFAALQRGGRYGPVIRAGDSKRSELAIRIALPRDNDKVMPPAGKPALSADEITVIGLWIDAGGSGMLSASAIRGAPPPVKKVEFPEVDLAAVARARAPLAQAVTRLQARFPGILSYESRDSADLEINASVLGRAFGDPDLAMLAPLREHIVLADLSGTSISDVSAQILTGCKRLHTLRLANTGVTEVTLHALSSLDKLRSITIMGTALRESDFPPLRDRGVKVYDGHDTMTDSNAKSS